MVRSVVSAACAKAASNWRNDDSGMTAVRNPSVQVGRLAAHRAVGGEHDFLDLHLGFGELVLAVALQQGAALVGRNRLVQFDLAALELLDDGFQLLQRVLEGQAGNVFGQCRFFGQFASLGERSPEGGADGSRTAADLPASVPAAPVDGEKYP